MTMTQISELHLSQQLHLPANIYYAQIWLSNQDN
jgi:hypothetical protein